MQAQIVPRHIEALRGLSALYPDNADLLELLEIDYRTLRRWRATGEIRYPMHRRRVRRLWEAEQEMGITTEVNREQDD